MNKKTIAVDKRANREISKFPLVVIARVEAHSRSLAKYGKLEEPLGKRINKSLFELRIKYKGEWRVLYSYLDNDVVILLSAFHKKTEQTPLNEIEKATKRLKEYII
ncbi:MAG TPA: type II toxin-antitoxin system RelE/ParE family toxin [Vitreimonas sp.]|nr:type II toxin-antitoxin system RelE/ParE family toxin [Vitreimonas sp.]